jgi:hypothetical protein
MVDVTPGDSGANKGFWRFQLRDRRTKQFIPMGGGVIFETTIPGVDGIVRARGFFRGMIDLETAKIEVMDNSEVPRGIYYVKSEFIEADKAKARIPKSFLKQKLPSTRKDVAPAAPPELKSSISGDEALKTRMKSVARALKEKGRFPMPRVSYTSTRGKTSDVTLGARTEFKKVFDSSPEVQDRFNNFESLWEYVSKNGADEQTQSPNQLSEIPEEMKLLNREYAKHVLGLDPNGTVTFYRNAINGKDTEQESAVGYLSLDRDMAYDYGATRGNVGANGRYEVDVKPDEVYGLLGYSQVEDEYGITIGREVANIPGRVRRVGDLAPVETADWIKDYADKFNRGKGQSAFRNFGVAAHYNFHEVENFLPENIQGFFEKYNVQASDISAKFDELYGEGSYAEYKASGNSVSYQEIQKMFVKLDNGNLGLNVEYLDSFNIAKDVESFKDDPLDNRLKMLSLFQELTGQYFMTYKTRDYTPPVKEKEEVVEAVEPEKPAEIVLPPKPREVPIPEGHVRLFHYTNDSAVESIRKNGLQAQKDGKAAADDNVSLIWASEGAPINGDKMFDERPIVEFHVPEEVWAKGAGLGFERTAMAGPVSAENIIAVHEPWHSITRSFLEVWAPEELIENFDGKDLSFLRDNDPQRAGLEAALKIARQILAQRADTAEEDTAQSGNIVLGDTTWDALPTEAQAKAIEDYGSGELAIDANSYLRTGKSEFYPLDENDPESIQESAKQHLDELKQRIDDLSSAFDSSSLSEDMTVYRSLSDPSFGFDYDLELGEGEVLDLSRLEGTIYTDKGFMSTTKKADFNYSASPIRLTINAKAGQKAIDVQGVVNLNPREGEILFPAGSKFRISKAYFDNNANKYHVEMDYLDGDTSDSPAEDISNSEPNMYEEFFDAGMIDLRRLRRSKSKIGAYDLELFSDDQVKALEWYGQAGHKAINKILRSGDPISEEDQKYIDAIDEAIEENGDVYSVGRVFRGDTPSSSSEYYKFLQGLTAGKVVNFPGYFSTSDDAIIAFSEFGPGTRENSEDASQGYGSSSFFWTIDIPENGKAMGMPEGVGFGQGVESEVLLPRNTKLKIIGIKKVEQIDEEDGSTGEFNYFIHAEQQVSVEVKDTQEARDTSGITYEEVDYYDVPVLEPKNALESVALSYYTGESNKPNGHKNMNIYLRTNQHADGVDTPTAQAYVLEKIELLKNIVNSQVIDKNIKVFRYQEELTEGLDQVGSVWTSDGFLSTSTATTRKGDQTVETEFAGLPVQIEINVPAGSRGGAINTALAVDEGEVLLPPGSRFIVENIEKTDLKTKVSLLLVGQDDLPENQSEPENLLAKTIANDLENKTGVALFTRIGPQLGSNEGGTFEGIDGTEYYVKTPKSEMHLKNELLASALYRLAGVDAAYMKHGVDKDGSDKLFSAIIPGDTLAETRVSDAIKRKIQENFAIDAWLANWDVAGSVDDNIIIDSDEVPHRIDLGGALLFRARGDQKGEAFGDEVTELGTLRNSNLNPTAAALFGDMGNADLKASASKLLNVSSKDIDILVDAIFSGDTATELKNRLKARRNYILDKFNLLESSELADYSSIDYPATDFSEVSVLNPLTIEESDALEYYTGDGKHIQDVGHHKINTWLREGEWYPSVTTPEEKAKILKNIGSLERVVNSNIINTDIKVFRYQSSVPQGLDEVGEIWTSDGFLSTSTATDGGKKIVTAFTYSSVTLEINIPGGFRGGAVDGSVEGEVLLPPGSNFLVQSVEKTGLNEKTIRLLLVGQDPSSNKNLLNILESEVEPANKKYSTIEDLVADSQAILEKIEELTDPSKSKVENGNIPMRALLELMGKGGKPQVVSAIEELDGGDMLYRGTTDENAENFINGDSDRIGLGHNGDGYYFTNVGRTAVEYAGEGSLLRGGWKRDAKVKRFTNPETALEDYKVASSEVSNKWAKKLKVLDGEPSEAEQEIFDNYAFYDVDAYITDLILQGFDGVEIAQPYGDEVFVIVFNREALKIVDQ